MKTNIEEMWSSYKSIAPTSFREKAQRAFFQRWWEMFIGIFLMESGFKITVARNDAGPDFRFIFQGATFVVEARHLRFRHLKLMAGKIMTHREMPLSILAKFLMT